MTGIAGMRIAGLSTDGGWARGRDGRFTERPESWRKGVLMNEPNGDAPLYALTSMLKNQNALNDTNYHWWEEYLNPLVFKFYFGANGYTTPFKAGKVLLRIGSPDTNASFAGDDSTNANKGGPDIVPQDQVTAPVLVKKGDILRCEANGALLYVTSSDTTAVEANSKTVAHEVSVRYCGPNDHAWTDVPVNFGNTVFGSANLADANKANLNPQVTYAGNSYEQGSLAPDPRTWSPFERMNQTQIFRDAFAMDNTTREIELRTGDAFKRDQARCRHKHMTAIERALFFSRMATDFTNTESSAPRRTMNGIYAQIPSARHFQVKNNNKVGGFVSYDMLDELVSEVFRYGGQEKVVFCGNRVMLAISQMARYSDGQFFTMKPGVRRYGWSFNELTFSHGTLMFKTHPMFNQHYSSVVGDTVNYASLDATMVCLEMGDLEYKYLKNRDTKMEKGLERIGEDAQKWGFLTECSICVKRPDRHMVIEGVVGGAKSQGRGASGNTIAQANGEGNQFAGVGD